MFNKSGKYINLKEHKDPSSRDTEIRVYPENRVTEVSGRNWRWVWNRPRGIILQKGRIEKRIPILDLTRILQTFLYGISALLLLIGVGKRIGSQSGE